MSTKTAKSGWRFGILASLALTAIAFIPEATLISNRAPDFHGAYFCSYYDEVAYSAYLNALITGRPRNNNPYTGRDALTVSPGSLPESLFSGQPLTAYLIALPARALGISASTSFRLLTIMGALLGGLSVFYLLRVITGEEKLAAAGALFVICFGALAGTFGDVSFTPNFSAGINFFSFLRRFQPAGTFPVLFLFFAASWKAFHDREPTGALIVSCLSLLYLSGSYFFSWTTAAGWLACLVLIMLITRRQSLGRLLPRVALIALPPACVIIPLALHITRSGSNATIGLTHTHRPDLARVPELIGLLVLAILFLLYRTGKLDTVSKETAIAASVFAFAPLLIFNQQVVTGLSLQPIHYEGYTTNYLSLVALWLTITVLPQAKAQRLQEPQMRGRLIWIISLLALGWGLVEATAMTARRMSYARFRDESVPVLARLKQLGETDGSGQPQMGSATPRPVVLATNITLSDNLPTVAPQAVLWAEHMRSFSDVSQEEFRERLFLQLYLTNFSIEDFARALDEKQFPLLVGLFGMDRAIPALSLLPQQITLDEAKLAVSEYQSFILAGGGPSINKYPITYLILNEKEAAATFSNLARYYQIEPETERKPFNLFRLKRK